MEPAPLPTPTSEYLDVVVAVVVVMAAAAAAVIAAAVVAVAKKPVFIRIEARFCRASIFCGCDLESLIAETTAGAGPGQSFPARPVQWPLAKWVYWGWAYPSPSLLCFATFSLQLRIEPANLVFGRRLGPDPVDADGPGRGAGR